MEFGAELLLLAASNCCGYTLAQQHADLALVLGCLALRQVVCNIFIAARCLKTFGLGAAEVWKPPPVLAPRWRGPSPKEISAHLRTQAVAPNKMWCCLLNLERKVVRRCWHFQNITFPMLRALLMPGSSLDYLVSNHSVQLTLEPLHQWGHLVFFLLPHFHFFWIVSLWYIWWWLAPRVIFKVVPM